MVSASPDIARSLPRADKLSGRVSWNCLGAERAVEPGELQIRSRRSGVTLRSRSATV